MTRRALRSRWLRAGFGAALCAAAWSCGGGGSSDGAEAAGFSQSVGKQGAELTLHLDRQAMTTADGAVLRLAVECAESDTIEFPDVDGGIGEFAVVGDQPLPPRLLEGGRVTRAREYELQPFLPGEYEVPALTVVLNGTVELTTDPLTVDVRSVIDDPESAELRDIGEPVDVPVPWWQWAALATALAAVLGGLAWWWRRRRLQKAAPRVVPPHEAALAALDALLAQGLLANGQIQAFYLRLSDIVRHYIEDRFGLRAPEQTTEEFLSGLPDAPQIGSEHQRLLRSFLRQADLVKFAKFEPGTEETGGAVDAARRFIEQTRPADPEEEGASASE